MLPFLIMVDWWTSSQIVSMGSVCVCVCVRARACVCYNTTRLGFSNSGFIVRCWLGWQVQFIKFKHNTWNKDLSRIAWTVSHHPCGMIWDCRYYCDLGYSMKSIFNPNIEESRFPITSISIVVLKCCSEHGSDTVVLRAKFQNGLKIRTYAIGVETSCKPASRFP